MQNHNRGRARLALSKHNVNRKEKAPLFSARYAIQSTIPAVLMNCHPSVRMTDIYPSLTGSRTKEMPLPPTPIRVSV